MRSTASRSSGKRSSISSGARRTRLAVAAPLALAAVERGAAADRDERRPAARARRGWCACTSPVATVADAERARRGRAARRCGARRRARTAAAARRRSARGRTRAPAARRRSGRRTPSPWRAQPERQTSPSLSSSSSAVERGRQRLAILRPRPRVRVRRGQQPAEVRVAALRLDEQRHVRAAGERHLGAGDRADAERLRRVRELERAVDAVVVGERERLVAELGGARARAPRAARRRRGTSRPSGRAARRSSRIGSAAVSVVPPGQDDKALLDELFVSVLEATMRAEPPCTASTSTRSSCSTGRSR